MSPSKMADISAFEVALNTREKRAQRNLNRVKNKKAFKVKQKERKKMGVMKSFVKGEGIKNTAFENVKKSIGQKLKFQDKKKGDKKTTRKQSPEAYMEDQNVSEVVSIENNSEQIDVQMKDESVTDSIRAGKDAFSWLIAPIKPEKFFQDAWEKAPMYVKRRDFPNYYKDILTSQKINEILRDNYVLFSKNIDVTSYRNGERETHNPEGRATPAVVWDFYKNGCSVRMLNPQTFCPGLRELNATLQDFFGCFVGANSYLTPANSQGFAPHYDDIEAFILQLEGKKHWKVYAPRNPQEVLPRFSSENFNQNDIQKPVLDVILNPGDLLYFPRGFIHQASTEPGHHSLHVTVSCYQKNSWGDLFEKLLPAALAIAQEEDVEFRKGLPLNYLSHMGLSNTDKDSAERKEFLSHMQMLFGRLLTHAPVDAAVDQMGKQFMHDALPPQLSADEEKCSVLCENLMTMNSDGSVSGIIKLTANSRIKLARSHVLRLVKEDAANDLVQVYHCMDNSLEYHGEDQMMFEVSCEFAHAIEQLVHSYPAFLSVSKLQLDSIADKIELANILWKKGLVLTEKPVNERKN